jgi:hypothetical protein
MMSNQSNSIEDNKEEQDSDVNKIEPGKNTVASQDNTAKIDINAWRKRRSVAFQRNPLMFRRMSRGEQIEKKCFAVVTTGVVLCLSCNVILSVLRGVSSAFKRN